MEQINEVIDLLKSLGYEPVHDEERLDINFKPLDYGTFPVEHKVLVKSILDCKLSNFYFDINKVQHIYYHQ